MEKDNKEFTIDTATKYAGQPKVNCKLTTEVFPKEANKGNAPKASDINNMIQKISKKEGEQK